QQRWLLRILLRDARWRGNDPQRLNKSRADVASVATTMENRKTNSGRLAYGALLIFSVLYYARPEDIIPGLHFIPWSKISGGIDLLAVIAVTAGNQVTTNLHL